MDHPMPATKSDTCLPICASKCLSHRRGLCGSWAKIWLRWSKTWSPALSYIYIYSYINRYPWDRQTLRTSRNHNYENMWVVLRCCSKCGVEICSKWRSGSYLEHHRPTILFPTFQSDVLSVCPSLYSCAVKSPLRLSLIHIWRCRRS